MELCLDIENSIKVRLINHIMCNENEDGYELIKSYLASEDPNFYTMKTIQRHKSGEYCKKLIEKYYPYFSVWTLVEVVPFGTLLHLSQYYKKKYHCQIMPKNKFMNTVRDLRNAAAHNNCLINNMIQKMHDSKQTDTRIVNFIKKMNIVSVEVRRRQLRKSFVYNIVTLLYVYDKVMTTDKKKIKFKQLSKLIHSGLTMHKEYFYGNSNIRSVPGFKLEVQH